MHITSPRVPFLVPFVPQKKRKKDMAVEKEMNAHLDAVGMSLVRSPYVGMYRFNETPRASFRSRISHLLRKRISWTYNARAHQFPLANAVRKQELTEGTKEITLPRSFDLQTVVHNLKLSSNRLIPESPSSLSSKTDMGTRKMIALTSVKYGCHTPRSRSLSDEGANTYPYDYAHVRS